MLRRVLDLSLKCEPLNTGPLLSRPLPSYIEPTGSGHPRQFVQRVCHTIPYAFNNDEIGIDVYLGDSLPHTHAESLLVNEITILSRIPEHQRWVVRDIAAVPAAEWVRDAAVIDLSHLGPNESPSLSAVQEASDHLMWGDFVIWRTGYQARVGGSCSDIESIRAPGIPIEVAQWLVEEKGIVGIMSDAPVDPVLDFGKVGAAAGGSHTYFYSNAILMIDDGINFDKLDADRLFLCGGLCLKSAGIGSCPARTIVLKGSSPDLANREIIDMFTMMQPSTGRSTANPIQCLEPFDLQPYIFKRYEVYGMQIAGDPADEASQACGSHIRPKRDFGSPIRLFNSHLGTHMRLPHAKSGHGRDGDLVVRDIADLSSGQLVGPALVLDLTSIGPRQVVSRHLLERKAIHLRPGDIILLWTGFSDRYYERPDFLQWSPRFDPKGIEWLLDRGAKMLVTDAASLEPHLWDDHLPSSVDPLLTDRAVPAVVCATNLWLLRKKRCFVVCSPIPLRGFPTAPTRVIAIEDWQ